MENILNQLKNSSGVKGEIDISEETLTKYSRDASIFEVRPACVVHPKDSEDVKALVKFVASNKEKDPNISITARSAGTDMSGGPLNEGIIADFTTHFNSILDWGPNFVDIQP